MHVGIFNKVYSQTFPDRSIKKTTEATKQYVLALLSFVVTGAFPWIQNAAGLEVYKSYGINSSISYVISQIMFGVIGHYDFSVLTYVPRLVFTVVLTVAGLGMIDTYLIKSYRNTPFPQYVPIPLFCGISYFFSSTIAIGALLVVSLGGVLWAVKGGSVVRYLANGLIVRSTVERGEIESNILDLKGDLIQCFFLQGSIFFGNGKSIKKYVQTMFDNVPRLPERLVEMLPPKPVCLVLDFSLVISLDVSAAAVIKDIVDLCHRNNCKSYFTGSHGLVTKILQMQELSVEWSSTFDEVGLCHRNNCKSYFTGSHGLVTKILQMQELSVEWSSTFDEGMIQAEEHILNEEEVMRTSGVEGFRGSLVAIERQQNLQGLTEKLEPHLTPLVKELNLRTGESVYDKARSIYGSNAGTVDVERGLFFIETGHIKVQKPSNQTLTRGGTLRREINKLSLGGSVGRKDARGLEIGRAGMRKKGIDRREHTFRLASMGPGWVLGCREVSGGLKFNGSYIAVTPSKLHYLPLSALSSLTEKSPLATLTLYKMMAHLVAKNLESATAQIDSFKNVIGGRGEGKPTKRETWARINDAMLKMHME
ncbi:hypothetical protein TL16_g05814 [Triparma laevis f. inornata]|uniref:STAS domain-containing protein n=1 Tax=Triparma laevis f. inornata TaxID=1714386 RepID=A0A9W7E896_9STRA|nr:hypothetical protein TL16_g05814 [Triparma laevis f. inornata]